MMIGFYAILRNAHENSRPIRMGVEFDDQEIESSIPIGNSVTWFGLQGCIMEVFAERADMRPLDWYVESLIPVPVDVLNEQIERLQNQEVYNITEAVITYWKRFYGEE